MPDRTQLFDPRAVAHRHARARQMGPAMFLQNEAFAEIEERLQLVNKSFTAPAIVTFWPEIWGKLSTGGDMVEGLETLSLEPGAHDLVVHAMALHAANDPVAQLIQCRRALKPDGLFQAVLFGGQTLTELRAVLAEAEAGITGGLSPRIAPMSEIRDLGALMQRAGFALPVADSVNLKVTYANAYALMRDLRAMGEGNALIGRARHFTRRAVFELAAEKYAAAFPADDGRVVATFELIFLSGWAPDASQPQPLRPGSATSRLADALGADETKILGDD